MIKSTLYLSMVFNFMLICAAVALNIEPSSDRLSRAIESYGAAQVEAAKSLTKLQADKQNASANVQLLQKLVVVISKRVLEKATNYAITRAKASLALSGSLQIESQLKDGTPQGVQDSMDADEKKSHREMAKMNKMAPSEAYQARKKLSVYNKAYESLLQKAALASDAYIKSMEEAQDEFKSMGKLSERELNKKLAYYEEEISQLQSRKDRLQSLMDSVQAGQSMEIAEAEEAAKDLVSDQGGPRENKLGLGKRHRKTASENEANGDGMVVGYTKEAWEKLGALGNGASVAGQNAMGFIQTLLDSQGKQIGRIESIGVPQEDADDTADANGIDVEIAKAFERQKNLINSSLRPSLEEQEKAEQNLVNHELFYNNFDISQQDFEQAYEDEWDPDYEEDQQNKEEND